MTMEKIFNLMASMANIFQMQLNSNCGKYTLFIVCKTPDLFGLAYELASNVCGGYDAVKGSEEDFRLIWDNGSEIIFEKWYEVD